MSYQAPPPSHGVASRKAPPPILRGPQAPAAAIYPASPEDVTMDAGSNARPGNLMHQQFVLETPPAASNRSAAAGSEAISNPDFGVGPIHQGKWKPEQISPGKAKLENEAESSRIQLQQASQQEQQALFRQEHGFP